MMVSDLFVHMSRGEPGAMIIVTSNSSQSTVSSWIRSLLDLLEPQPDWAHDAREALTEIDVLRADRNALVHGQWTPNDGGITALVHSAKIERREILKSELVTTSDLNDTLDRIRDVTVDFVSVMRASGVANY
jgi:hypothetical protein